jgi:transcription elongation factor Elf1
MMKAKLLAILVVAMLVAGVAMADPEDGAKGKVWVDVVANVAVNFQGTGYLGQIQTGKIEGELEFRIDANTEAVDIYLCVSDLWKGNDPAGTEVTPIPVVMDWGVKVDCENANEVAGGDNRLAYISTPCTIEAKEGIFPAVCTEVGRFESSQNGHFSQSVWVYPKWRQDDNEKPMGEYSGYVKLVCAVVPVVGPIPAGI